jgi:hypothetical protein
MELTREQKEKIILDYLCYGQIGEYVRGEDSNDNSTEIQWIPSRCEWQIIDIYHGETHIAYESGGCESAVAVLDDEILDDMISNIYDEDELHEMFELENQEEE